MSTFEHRFVVSGSVADVAAFHRDPQAFRKLVPPGMILQIHKQEPLANESVNEFTMWMGPVPVYWKAVHSDVTDEGFTDHQAAGPMRSWVHRHSYGQVSAGEAVVVDRIDYEHFSGWRGIRSRLLFSRMGLSVLFAWRAWATRRGVNALASARSEQGQSS